MNIKNHVNLANLKSNTNYTNSTNNNLTSNKPHPAKFIITATLIMTLLISALCLPAFNAGAVTYNGAFSFGDFEGSVSDISVNWSNLTNANACFQLSTDENHTLGGSQCLAVYPRGGAWQATTYYDDNNDLGIAIIPGGIYRISFWHKGAANGQFQVADYGIPNANIPGYKEAGVADEEWTYYSSRFVANTRTRLAPIDLKNTLGETEVTEVSYFDDLTIEMISEPTTPRPAAELTTDETISGKHETMDIGTNFWFHTYWSGCTPMKTNIDWATAYSSGTDIWDETFVSELQPFTVLRFMDWGNTNGSTIVNWSQRRLPNSPKNFDVCSDPDNASGLAYEWMIDLCNRTNKDCWICVPSSSSDDYLHELAKLCKEKIKPGLKLYIEYSNEVWNWGFQQATYAEEMGKKTTEIGLTEDTKFTENYNANYYVYRSFQLFQIFEEVYGFDAMRENVYRICATSGNTALYDAGYGNVFNSEIYNPHDQRADYLAVAPYVGSGLDGYDQDITTKFHEAIDSTLEGYVKSSYNMAKKYGMPLIAYEGGQHLLLGADAWSSNPDIYNQYIYMLNKFAPYFDMFCHYCLTGGWGSGGAWGAENTTGQPLEEAHKLRALYDWIKAPTIPYDTVEFPKFAPGNASFQHGLDNWVTSAKEGTYSIVNNSTATEDVGHPHYLAFRNLNNENAGAIFETSFYLTPGKKYTMKYDLTAYAAEGYDNSPLIGVNLLDWSTSANITGKNWTGPAWGTQTIEEFEIPPTSTGLVKIRFGLSCWDPTGINNFHGKIDNFRIFEFGTAEPADPVEANGTLVYQPEPLPVVTPIPLRNPPTPKPTVAPTENVTSTTTPSSTPSPAMTNGVETTQTPEASKSGDLQSSPEPVASSITTTTPDPYPAVTIPALPTGPLVFNNTIIKRNGLIYTVTKGASLTSAPGTVTLTKSTLTKNRKSIKIPSQIIQDGIKLNVVSTSKGVFKSYKKLKKVTIGTQLVTISGSCFKGCSSLKLISISSRLLKKVGGQAIYGINKKAVIKVPGNKLKAYKKLFNLSSGFRKKTMRIKKK